MTGVRIALLFLPLALHGQVRVIWTPESLRSNVLGVNQIGEWDVGVVNRGSAPVTKSLTELLMLAPKIHRISPARTAQILATDVSKSKAQRIIRLLSYADIIGPGISPGWVSLTARGVAAVALGTAIIHRATDDLKARQPSAAAYTADACPDQISLSAYGQSGYAVTCSIFSSLVHGADTIGPVDIGP